MFDLTQFLEWVRHHYDEEMHDLLVQKMNDEPNREPQVILNEILQDKYGGPAPTNIDQIHFLS